MTGVFIDDDDVLPNYPTEVERIMFEAEEPLTISEIMRRRKAKRKLETKKQLEELMEKGVVEKGPPEKADGIMGLVEQEPTYQLAQTEVFETDER